MHEWFYRAEGLTLAGLTALTLALALCGQSAAIHTGAWALFGWCVVLGYDPTVRGDR